MKKIAPALLLGALLGLLVAPAGSAQEMRKLFGLMFSYFSYEEFQMSVGLDTLGNPRKPKKIEEFREHLLYPEHYGDLIQVTTLGDRTQLWFRDTRGIVRNAILEEADRRLYRIESMEIKRYRSEPAK